MINVNHELAALLPHFLEETAPLVEALGQATVALEAVWASGQRDAAVEARALGDVHTIKGNGAMMGFEPIQSAAHALEDLLEAPGAGTRAGGALLVRGGDLLGGLLTGCEAGELDGAAVQRFVTAVADYLGGVRDSAPERPLRLAPIGKAAETIRVDFRRLDELAALVACAVTAQAAATTHLDAGVLPAARAAAPAVSAALDQLAAALLDIRLTRVGALFDRFGRYVRELARGIGQPVRLVLRGGEAAIDKAIVDRLGEPLLHMIRNAVAHGIEPVAQRLAAGKPAEATIGLAAECRGDRVIVTVSDDGRGLDLGAIAERARQLGVDVDRLDEPARRQLIFLPGLSTASRLSTLAGRGVGLDIVAGVIAGLRGTIDVHSEPARGATFRFDLPRALGPSPRAVA